MSGLCSGGANDAFALVAYLPEPLAGFVNRVRHELAPGCRLRAHITILPPRQIACDVSIASRQLKASLARSRSFRLETEQIEVFPVSNVLYLSIGPGLQELKDLHASLNQGSCLSSEVWCYHPHVTLAQNLPPEAIDGARELAERRWREYAGPRDFTLNKLAFVQGNPEAGWVDLAQFDLLSPVMAA